MADPGVNASEFTLNVGHYTRAARARILYNHLYFSDLARADVEQLVADNYFLKMIDHRNFNPRLIELLTTPDYIALAAKPIRLVVDEVLDNPHELWERPYRTHMSAESRAIMLSLYFNDRATGILDLEETFERILDATESRLSTFERPAAFRRSLKELEGSVLAIHERTVRFANPGVRDFLDRAVESDRFLPLALGVLSEYAELSQCWELFTKSQPSGQTLKDYQRLWSEALGRMVAGNSGTALERFELAINLYDQFNNESLFLGHVGTAMADLALASTDETEVRRCRSVLEQLVLTLLPREVADEARDGMASFVARMLSEAGGALTIEDVEMIADALFKYGRENGETRAAVQDALKAQVDEIDTALREFGNIDDLDSYEAWLEAVMKKFHYQDKRVERDIRYRRESLLERDEAPTEIQYKSISRRERPETSDEEIRSMFQGLSRSH
jgi:hypothetical protein